MPIYDAKQVLTAGKYDQLPRLLKKTKPNIPLKILNIVTRVLLIGTLVRLLFVGIAGSFLRVDNLGKQKKATPLARARLKETQQKICAIAKKAGVTNPNRFKVYIGDPFSSPAAFGRSVILIPSNELVQPDDLPAHLKLTNIDSGKISEDEWVVKFSDWLSTAFVPHKRLPFKTQFGVDVALAHGKLWLQYMRNSKRREAVFEGVVGHELGHCVKHHLLRSALADLGWGILSPLSLGLSLIFEKKIMGPLKRKHEKEADMFSAKKLGTTNGINDFFNEITKVNRILHVKYPERYNAAGDNPHDCDHPPLTQRLRYLTPFMTAAAKARS